MCGAKNELFENQERDSSREARMLEGNALIKPRRRRESVYMYVSVIMSATMCTNLRWQVSAAGACEEKMLWKRTCGVAQHDV